MTKASLIIAELSDAQISRQCTCIYKFSSYLAGYTVVLR